MEVKFDSKLFTEAGFAIDKESYPWKVWKGNERFTIRTDRECSFEMLYGLNKAQGCLDGCIVKTVDQCIFKIIKAEKDLYCLIKILPENSGEVKNGCTAPRYKQNNSLLSCVYGSDKNVGYFFAVIKVWSSLENYINDRIQNGN